MIKRKIAKSVAQEFFDSLRKEDKAEILYYFKENAKKEFVRIMLNSKGCYVFDDDNKLIAAGGIEDFKVKQSNLKYAQIWLLFSKDAKKQKVFLFKYIKKRLNEAFKNYDVLFNYIYKTNFKALIWIEKCASKNVNFKVYDTISPDLKLFYFSKGDTKIDIRNFTRQ